MGIGGICFAAGRNADGGILAGTADDYFQKKRMLCHMKRPAD